MQNHVIFDYGLDILRFERPLAKVEMGVYIGTLEPDLVKNDVIPFHKVGIFTPALKKFYVSFDGVTECAFCSFYPEFVEASVTCDRSMYCATFTVVINKIVDNIHFYPEKSDDVDLQFYVILLEWVAR